MSLNHTLSVGYYLQSANLLLRQGFLYSTEIIFAFHFHFRDEGFFLFVSFPSSLALHLPPPRVVLLVSEIERSIQIICDWATLCIQQGFTFPMLFQ